MDMSRYSETSYVGSGGMASVYKAFDQKLRRHVAIKELNEQFRENDEVRNLFLNEARKMALVKHQNVVQVYDILEGDKPTIIMEYMGGGSLATRVGTSSLPVDVVLQIVRQIATGLRAIHEAGLVHRDIKPENILEESGKYKITDFGVAISGEEEAMPFVTNKYAAPEVLIEPSKIGQSSDIYSLGIIAVELLLGPREFELAVKEAIEQDTELALPAIQNSAQAFWQQWVASPTELPPLNKIDESIPQEVSDFLGHVTRRDRSERVPDCRAFIKELDGVIAQTGQRASAETEYSDKMKRRLEKVQTAKSAGTEKAKKPLWFKVVASVGMLLIVALIALILMPSGPAYYYFNVVTEPEGAAILWNGEPTEAETSPGQIVATWGDTVTLSLDGGEPTDIVLQEDMANLTVVQDQYEYTLEVELIAPLEITTSKEAAAYLNEKLDTPWPVDASIPGFDGAGLIPVPIGTEITFNVTSNKAGSLMLLHLSADNYATVIYPAPNGFAPEIEAGNMLNVGEELRLVTREPLGREWLYFVIADGLEAPPEPDGVISIENTMRAYPISGRGSPGQELVTWLAEAVRVVQASTTRLDVEIVGNGAAE
jgi:tRNA A-37 threonylcarbamoyl transferase component Bud32